MYIYVCIYMYDEDEEDVKDSTPSRIWGGADVVYTLNMCICMYINICMHVYV